jgi:hypothetical protein
MFYLPHPDKVKTRNETILIGFKDVMFSENIYAWFEYEQYPVLSNRIEDLCLPENFRFEFMEQEGAYEIYEYNKDIGEYLYAGRLYTPKEQPLKL